MKHFDLTDTMVWIPCYTASSFIGLLISHPLGNLAQMRLSSAFVALLYIGTISPLIGEKIEDMRGAYINN